MRLRELYIELNRLPGLGPVTIGRLVEAFGSGSGIGRASHRALREILGRYGTPETLAGIRRAAAGGGAEAELREADRRQVRIATLADADYPEAVRFLADPPPVLYVRGTLLREDRAAVSLVGTRAASAYGLAAARRLAEGLAGRGLTVVSGLAEGIDGAAHAGALEAGGRTLAVLGHGLDALYPPIHRALARRVAEAGALVTEFPFGRPPDKTTFPRRNRLIAALSLGVVVVEAPARSGALITARQAAEQGREVFAVPGPVTSPASEGPHALLRDGAVLVRRPEDVLEALDAPLRALLRDWKRDVRQTLPKEGLASDLGPALSEAERVVLGSVPAGEAVAAEQVGRRTGLPAHRLQGILTELEMKGLIQSVRGGGFSRP